MRVILSVLILSFTFFSLASPKPLSKRITRPLRFNYGVEKVRGVNLGGWLVLEPWVTPSIFQDTPEYVVDEYTLCSFLGPKDCLNLLSEHWDTWIVEDDFAEIQARGLNHVRIPIGYWSISPDAGDTYIQGAYHKLKEALIWATKYDLMVIIDLHGAQGSQNGFDNSGRRGNILFGQDDNMAKARDVLGILQHEFSDNHAVAAIEAVNEPIATVVGIDQLNQYYYDAWIINSDSPLVTLIHDGFLGASAWNSFGPGLDAIMIDTHHYEVFDISQLQMTSDAHAASACAFGSQLQGGSLWTIVGEWSGATTDCAKWLNGRGVGSRYDGTFNAKNPSSPYIDSCEGRDQGSVGTLSQQDQQNLRKFIEAQLQAYEKSQGWIFWTWKTESSPEWDMQQLFNAGIFPGDLTNITSELWTC